MNSLGASWVVKRLTKVFLKRHLSHLLATEVDVQQLEIQLENGSFEIRDCLLDSEYLNSKLADYPVSIESALVERIKISLFPLTIECHGVAIVLSERGLVTREKEADKDLPGGRIEKSSDSILDDGLGLMEDIMQGLFSKLSIKGRDILICATLLTGHELCLVTKQISLVSDAEDLAKKIDLGGLSFKIIDHEGVEHLRTHPIQASVLLSQEAYSQKEQEPRTVLSFTILQTITLYATEVAVSLLQHLVLVIRSWKSAIHLSGEIPEDFSQSLHKVLGLPESINSNSADIWQTLEERAMTGKLDDSEEDENTMSALDDLMSAIFFSTESILQGNDEDGQHSVYCIKGQIPGCTLKLCSSTEDSSGGNLYFSLEDIDFLCNLKEPCECDVSFESLQICNQLDRMVKTTEDQASIFDQWLMPEDPIVFSSAKNESTMADTVKKLENLEKEHTGKTVLEDRTKNTSLVPIFSCQQQGYRQRISANFSDSVHITMTLDLMTLWLDNLIAVRVPLLSESAQIGKNHDQRQDFELTFNFRKILLGAWSHNSEQQVQCVLMLQTEQGGANNDIASESLHALVTSDSISISAQIEEMYLSIGTDKSDSDFLRFQGVKFQYLMSDETTIAIKSKKDDLRGQISVRNFNQIKSVIQDFRQQIQDISTANSKSAVYQPYSLTLDAATIHCELHVDLGYLKGSVHVVDLTFRSGDPTMSCEEFHVDILDAAIWQQKSERSSQAQSYDICSCEIKSIVLLLHGANEMVPDFRVNARSVCIGYQKEFLAVSTVSLEHTCSDAGIVAMFSGIRMTQDEYTMVAVANVYLLLSNSKVRCVQRSLERLRNIFVPNQVGRQQSPRSSVSFQMLTSAEASDKRTKLYTCNALTSEICGLVHEGMWYDQEIKSEYSESVSDSVEVECVYQSDYVGTKIENSLVGKRSLEVSVDRFELLYEDDPVDSPNESHGSLRFNCTTVKYQKNSHDSEFSRISAGSISAYFSYESLSDHVLEELVLEMPRKSLLRSENALFVDFQEYQGKRTLSINASNFRLCIRYCFLDWLSEVSKGLSIGDWEDVGEESDLSFDLRFRGASCSFTYVPSNAKLSSMTSKSPEDLLRLVPKLQAELWLCEASLVDAIELQAAGRMLVSMWLNDITKVQLNRFLLDLPGYRAMRHIKERTNWNLDDSSVENVALRFLFSLARYLETEQKTS